LEWSFGRALLYKFTADHRLKLNLYPGGGSLSIRNSEDGADEMRDESWMIGISETFVSLMDKSLKIEAF
jgi:hypothetical protein